MLTKLILVRHAEAEGNIKREFHGWTDGDITEKGHIQAKLAANKLKEVKIDVLYSSSMKRTLQTAGYIAEVKNLPIIPTDKLKEINGGQWEGQPWEELPLKWPEEYRTWENKPHIHKMPKGESMEEFHKRLVEEVKYIIKNNEGKNICIVTHGTAIRTILCFFYGCGLEEMCNVGWHDNTSMTFIDYENGKFNVVIEGDASHLGKEYSTIQNQKWWLEYMENREKK